MCRQNVIIEFDSRCRHDRQFSIKMGPDGNHVRFETLEACIRSGLGTTIDVSKRCATDREKDAAESLMKKESDLRLIDTCRDALSVIEKNNDIDSSKTVITG